MLAARFTTRACSVGERGEAVVGVSGSGTEEAGAVLIVFVGELVASVASVVSGEVEVADVIVWAWVTDTIPANKPRASMLATGSDTT
jgi:hypothetical protein